MEKRGGAAAAGKKEHIIRAWNGGWISWHGTQDMFSKILEGVEGLAKEDGPSCCICIPSHIQRFDFKEGVWHKGKGILENNTTKLNAWLQKKIFLASFPL